MRACAYILNKNLLLKYSLTSIQLTSNLKNKANTEKKDKEGYSNIK